MTTSINTLPDDALLDIFFIAREHAPFSHPLIAISNICKRWRCLALSTPLLWNNLHLEGSQFGGSTEARIQITELYFQRSSPLLMDLVIKERSGTMRIARILEPYAPRIRGLDLDPSAISVYELKLILKLVGSRAIHLLSMQFPHLQFDYKPWNGDDCEEEEYEEEMPTEAPPPLPIQLEILALPRETCLECLPFPISSTRQLELKLFVPTHSALYFLFHNMPLLSSLAIDIDHDPTTQQRHFYSHDPTINIDMKASTLIPSSSLQKLALHIGCNDAEHWYATCMGALGLLDVQNLEHLELHTRYTLRENPYHSIIQSWKSKLFSLKTLVLSSLDLLATIDSEELIQIPSSHPAGIHLVIQALPTFEDYLKILSSFTNIASATFYLFDITMWTVFTSKYDGVPEQLKEACNVPFPITFIATQMWEENIRGFSFRSKCEQVNEGPFCEAVDCIRHLIKAGKGGPFMVQFIDSPACFPKLFSTTYIEYQDQANLDQEEYSEDRMREENSE